MNKKGFTLLELLVVVFIIGILAAIALPKYQLAIDKTNFATYQTWAKSIADAYRSYILIHNDIPSDIDQLDLDMPAGYKKTSPNKQSCAVFNNMFCCITYPEVQYQGGSVFCGHKNDTIAFKLSIVGYNVNQDSYTKYCYAKTDNIRAVRVCESMSYTSKNSTNLPTQYGHLSGYTYYKLN